MEEKKRKKTFSPFLRLTVSRQEKEYVLERLGIQLAAGIDALTGVQSISKDVKSGSFKKVLAWVSAQVDAGSTLWKAFQATGLYPSYVISLLRIGEESGRLTQNLQVIVLQQQKDRDFRSRLRSALMYPVLVLGLTGTVGVGIAWFILPRLTNVFSSLNLELPTITKVLFAIGAFFQSYASIVIPSFLAAMAVIFYVLFLNANTKVTGQWLLRHMPGVGRLIQELELSRFGYILGTLLQAGLPIVEALESLADASSTLAYRKLYTYMQHQISDGQTFHNIFESYKRSHKLIPHSIQQMVVSGEQSGSLPEVLQHIGGTFEKKTETTTKNLSVILEPILLFIVWGGVILVAVAVVLPVYSLIGNFQV